MCAALNGVTDMAKPLLVSNTVYKIEKNIPIPFSSGQGRFPKYPFAQMQVGDSVLIPLNSRSAAYSWAKLHDRRFTCRPEGTKSVRVWRIA